MSVVRTQVNHHQNDIGPVRCSFAVTEQVVVRDLMKTQAPIAVQGRILTPDVIHAADKFTKTVRSIEVPLLDLVFFRVQVLLASRFAGQMLSELERRAVNPITGT